MRLHTRLAAVAGTLGLVATGFLVAGGPAQAAACGTGGTTFISTHTTDGRTAFTDTNDWGGGAGCLTVPDTTSTGGGAFTEQGQTAAYTGAVRSAPEIMIGCRSGSCTFGNGLDQAYSAAPDPKITWSYDDSGADAANAAWDAEINTNWSTDCVATDTSPPAKLVIGVYLTAHYPLKNLLQSYVKFGLANTGTVTIDGINWYLLHVEHGSGASATYKVEFAAQAKQSSITSLDMKAFYDYINTNQSGWTTDGTKFIRTTDCLRETDADYENFALGGAWTGSPGGPGLKAGKLGIVGP